MMNRKWVMSGISSVALLTLAAGCGSAASPKPGPVSTSTSQSVQVAKTTPVAMQIINNKNPDWPKFTNPFWSVKAGSTVVLTIQSFDDGTAPLPQNSPYQKVSGTVGGSELIDGKAATSVPNTQIAHTFTIPALGLNVVIPAAPKGGSVTVTATFKTPKAGSFVWQCEAPCGTGPTGWGGAMITPGWMVGTITVK